MEEQYFLEPTEGSKIFNEENGKLNVNTLLVSERYLVIAR